VVVDRAPSSNIARRRLERRAADGRRSDERWAAILAAATVVFRELGYEKATLENIAAEVGINRATLYYYVGTKEELLVALLTEPIETVRTRLEEYAAGDMPAPEKLAAALSSYVRTLDEHPELFIFLSENVHAVMSGPEADALRANADRYGYVLTQVIRDGAAAGEFRSDVDPQVAVLAILGMFNWMHRWYRPGGRRSLLEIGEEIVQLSLAALEPRPEPCASL
jgi:TetR/AcrR family transcriptional regulator, cholesterol catabolism regulator